MAVRQYIGARYMPKFMGTYNATQAYEALSVVDNGMGTTYICNKPTPSGTPLTDTNYWLIYGTSSGAIINLQNQINDMNNGDIPGSLQAQINTNADDIDVVENALAKKYVFIGDSYGANYTYAGTPITGWLSRMSALGLNVDAQSIAISGYGFIGYDGSWIDLINNMTVDDSVTDVCIIGGGNDIGRTGTQYSTLVSAIRNTIDAAKAKFPNAKIWVGMCAILYDNLNTNDLMNLTYIYSVESTAKGAAFMDGLQYVLWNTALCTDNNHPNNAGAAYLADAISSILKGGNFASILPYTICSRTTDANVNATTVSAIRCKRNNDLLTITGASGSYNWSASTSNPINIEANGNNAFVIGIYNTIPINKSRVILGTIPIMAVWSSGGVRNCAGLFMLQDGYLKVYVKDTTGSNYYNHNGNDTLVGVECQQFIFNTTVVRDYGE